MNPENIKQTIQAVIDGLTPLAQKPAIPIEYLWVWSVKHTYAVAVAELIPVLIFVIVTLLFIRAYKKAEKDEWQHESSVVPVVVLGVTMLVAGMLSIAIGPEALMRFISPEWYTIKDLTDLMK